MSVELSNSEEKPHCSYSNDAKSSLEKDISQPKKGRRGIKRLSRPRRTSTCSSVSEPTETIDINGFDSDSDEDSTFDFEDNQTPRESWGDIRKRTSTSASFDDSLHFDDSLLGSGNFYLRELSKEHPSVISNVESYTDSTYYVMMQTDTRTLRRLLIRQQSEAHRRQDFEDSFNSDDSDSADDLQQMRFKHIVKAREEISVNEDFQLESWVGQECEICLKFKALTLRSCCKHSICNECISNYVATRVNSSSDKRNFECPNCEKFMTTTEIILRLKYSTFKDELKLFYKKLHEASLKPGQYLCPNCGTFLDAVKSVTKPDSVNESLRNRKLCHFCELETCARCKSPWHKGVSCKQYVKGEKSMLIWAKAKGKKAGRMATKCPGCKRWYQKSDGCDHMTCTYCKTEFFYSCGCRRYGKYFDLLGSHSNRLSVFGCRNNFLRKHKVARRTIRGGILVGVVTVVSPVALPVAAVGGAAVLVAIGGIKAGKKVRSIANRK